MGLPEGQARAHGSRPEDQWRPVMHVTSLARDPFAKDFGERINQVKPQELPPADSPASTSSEEDRQRELWD